MRNYDAALEDYLASLKREPTHGRALSRVAELYYRKAEYRKGLEYAERALQHDTYAPDANYIYGVLQKELENRARAGEAFSIAARSMEYRSESYRQLAALQMQKEAHETAIKYARKALDYNRYNLAGYEILAAAYRKRGRIKEAEEVLDRLLETDPLSHHARYEQYLLQPGAEKLEAFTSLIRNEFPHETYLELAMDYLSLGLEAEAVTLLEQAPAHPVVYYWLAYLHKDASDSESRNYLQMADRRSPELAFPFRRESLQPLSWAAAQGDSWKSSYYLGLVYWNLTRPEKARQLFEDLGTQPDFAPFYLVRGRLHEEGGSDPALVERDFERAVELEPGEWRTWHFLSARHYTAGAVNEAFENARKAYGRFPDHPVIGMDYAKTVLYSGRYREGLDVLEGIHILPQEGAREGHDIYEATSLYLALEHLKKENYTAALDYLEQSRRWPEHLGAGRPFDPDERLQDYLASYIEARRGNSGRSRQWLDRIENYTLEHRAEGGHGNPTNDVVGLYIGLEVLKEAGMESRANRMVEGWKTAQDSLKKWGISQGTDSPRARWLLARHYDREPEYKALENRFRADHVKDELRLLLEFMEIKNRDRTR